MFSHAGDLGWEQHVVVAVLLWGGPLGLTHPLHVFWGKDATWGFISFQGCSWAGRSLEMPHQRQNCFFFPYSSQQKKSMKDGGGADPQYLGCLNSLCIGCWSMGSSSLSPYPKKAPQRRTLCRFARQPSQTILLLCPMEFASFLPPSSFFFLLSLQIAARKTL